MNNAQNPGPITKIGQYIHAEKYRGLNETFYDAMVRIAASLADSETHRQNIKEILLDQRFMPGGRIQLAIGAPVQSTPYNCFVSGIIEDSMESIMDKAKEAALTMRRGGGIGYSFGHIRPRGDLIKSFNSPASGPVSFMEIFDAVCKTIKSSGNRRGAQMGILPVSHPDVEEFIQCKQNETALTQFNISIGITDEFMRCLTANRPFDLIFNKQSYKKVCPTALWEKIMRSTWDYAEPGVVFLDRINNENNLYYCETIEATNPCSEQPLPPYGACLLGSFNLVKYCDEKEFNFNQYIKDIPIVVRAMDNVIDKALYPLKRQEKEAKIKRRMGLGITGLANAGEYYGYEYGGKDFIKFERKVLKILRDESYTASVELAKEKGAFPKFKEEYLGSLHIKKLPKHIQNEISTHGIRNSHLTSIAPTGTISLSADNVSSGIEPVFLHDYERTIQTENGVIVEEVEDYAKMKWGILGKTSEQVTVQEHLDVLLTAQEYIDSAVSKTCNVGDDVTWEEFKNIYYNAWKGGAKGITTFRAAGRRFGILNKKADSSSCLNGSCDI